MATKAELEAELDALKRKLKEREAVAPPQDRISVDPEAKHDSSKVAVLKSALKEHGIDTDDLGTTAEKLVQELTALHKEKPMIVLIAAFALGCVVGRASK